MAFSTIALARGKKRENSREPKDLTTIKSQGRKQDHHKIFPPTPVPHNSPTLSQLLSQECP
jgi:hypothetical protein